PSERAERALIPKVASAVFLELRLPKIQTRFRHSTVRASGMAMPEAAVNEDRCAVSREHDIEVSGQTGRMQAIAEAERPEDLPHGPLGLRVLVADPARSLAALC